MNNFIQTRTSVLFVCLAKSNKYLRGMATNKHYIFQIAENAVQLSSPDLKPLENPNRPIEGWG